MGDMGNYVTVSKLPKQQGMNKYIINNLSDTTPLVKVKS
jgi:hypothetical protein